MSSPLTRELYSNREETGDVTFIVGSAHIKAHRNVLAALSPKYKVQFYGSCPDDNFVDVVGFSAAAFAEFIKFFYLNEALITMNNIDEIVNLAKQSLFDRLITECEYFLCKSMNEKNVCRIYELALLCDLNAVKSACEFQIGEAYVPGLFLTAGFLGVTIATLLSILDIDVLNCTEVTVFKGCIKWAVTACQRNGLYDVKGSDLRAKLSAAFQKIRFNSMTLHEFIRLYEEHQGFFSLEEYVEITKVIAGHTTTLNINQALRRVPTKFQPLVMGERQPGEGISRFNCISAMEEFGDKSFEELRFQYYSLCVGGPRGGQQAGVSPLNGFFSKPVAQLQPKKRTVRKMRTMNRK